jgi:lysozyme
MNAAQALTITAAGALLLAADGDLVGAIAPGQLVDDAIGLFNVITETESNVDTNTATRNTAAFLQVLRQAEGTEGQPDPYRVCYGYAHTIQSLADHPSVTGEWMGERLPDAMCANAGFGPGCKSTAAGAYQLIKPTWLDLRAALGLGDFGPANQDLAALHLVRRRGAIEDVKAGRFATAISKCRSVWASLPGNYAKQGQRSLELLTAWYRDAGGNPA